MKINFVFTYDLFIFVNEITCTEKEKPAIFLGPQQPPFLAPTLNFPGLAAGLPLHKQMLLSPLLAAASTAGHPLLAAASHTGVCLN